MANMALMRQKQVSSHVRKLSITLRERRRRHQASSPPTKKGYLYEIYLLKYRVNNCFLFLENTMDKRRILTKQREKQRKKLNT